MRFRGLALISLMIQIGVVSNGQSKNETDTIGHQFDVGIDYASTNAAFGQKNFETTQPTFSNYIIYTTPIGLTLTGILNHILNSDSTGNKPTRSFDATLGYSKTVLNNSLTFYPSFSHFFNSTDAQTYTSSVKNQWSMDVMYSAKWFELSGNASLLRGDYNDVIAQLELGKIFTINSIISENDDLEIYPSIGIYWGKYDYQQVVMSKQLQKLIDRRKGKPSRLIGNLNSKLKDKLQEFNNEYLNCEKLNNTERLSSYLARLENAIQPKFGLKTVEVSLPITYSIQSFSLTATIYANRALKGISGNNSKFEFMYSFGINYTFTKP